MYHTLFHHAKANLDIETYSLKSANSSYIYVMKPFALKHRKKQIFQYNIFREHNTNWKTKMDLIWWFVMTDVKLKYLANGLNRKRIFQVYHMIPFFKLTLPRFFFTFFPLLRLLLSPMTSSLSELSSSTSLCSSHSSSWSSKSSFSNLCLTSASFLCTSRTTFIRFWSWLFSSKRPDPRKSRWVFSIYL